MANGHGGYRKPGNPAPVSGPGKLSRRTDGKANVMDLPDAAYGENTNFRDIQGGAPMGGAGMPTGAPATAPEVITPLGAGTAMPTTPVTDGADMGPGQSMAALGLPNLDTADAEDLRKYLPVLLGIANREDTPRGTKTFIRRLIATL